MPASTQGDEEATISIPSIAFVAVLSYFLYRYFISSRSNNTSTNRPNGLRFTAAQVETVASMFPQLSRRDIMWDLHRNRGSTQATIERVLTGRGLDAAPPSFQPPIATTTPSSSATPIPTSKTPKPELDLITRYNLQSRISSNAKGKERATDDAPPAGWAPSKDQRQQMLQRRRDEMILAARRKMMEKEEEGGGSTGL